MDIEGKKAKQKIHLHFETNIPYDTSLWMFNGVKIQGDFLDLKPGNHEVEVILNTARAMSKGNNAPRPVFDRGSGNGGSPNSAEATQQALRAAIDRAKAKAR